MQLLMDDLANPGSCAAAFLPEPLFSQAIQQRPEYLHLADETGHLPVHIAALSGNTEVLMVLLKNPAFLEVKTSSGATPLILAAQYGQLESLQKLIALGANCNAILPNTLFPLYIAVSNNFMELALWMIAELAQLQLNNTLANKMTVLHLAIELGATDIALILIQKGADCTILREADGFSALHCAAQLGQVAVLKAMQAQGVALNFPLLCGKTPLDLAAESGKVEVMNYLLSQGLAINTLPSNQDTTLMLALKAGQHETAKLLAKLAKLNVHNKVGENASTLAIKHAMPDIADLLLARGEVITPDYLYYLVKNGDYARVSHLMNQNVDFTQAYQGKNLLEIAAHYGHFLIVYEFMDQGLLPITDQVVEQGIHKDEVRFLRDWLEENPDANKHTFTKIAASAGALKCFDYLTKQEEGIEFENFLRISLENGQERLLESLILKVKDINKPLDKNENTALHLATVAGLKNCVKQLLQVGARIQKNQAGETPLHIAFHQENNAILKCLLKGSEPASWPSDLWEFPLSLKSPLKNTLMKFKRERFLKPVLVKETPALLFPEVSETKLQVLFYLLKRRIYDEILHLMEEDTNIILLFKSKTGGKLLACLFENLRLGLDASDSLYNPAMLLEILKNNGINPGLYLGEDNLLLKILGAKNEALACYKLTLLTKYFSKAFLILMQDRKEADRGFLEIAVRKNWLKLFMHLHTLCMEKHVHTERVFSGLHTACEIGNYQQVDFLLKTYPANLLNKAKQTPLMFAASNGNVKVVELLLSTGAKADLKDIKGLQALHYAIIHKQEETALRLLPFLQYPDAPTNKGIQAFSMAAAEGMLSVMRYLASEKNYAAIVDKKGANALHYASLAGQMEVIEYLVKELGFALNQADQSPLKHSPLHLATLKNKRDAVSTLINLGADISQEDAIGNTLVEYAIMGKDPGMLELVQQLVIYHDRIRDRPMLFAAIQADNEDVLNELILDDADLNLLDKQGNTTLYVAAMHDAGNCMDVLVNTDAMLLDLSNKEGNTALHAAAFHGHVRIITRLIVAGANKNKQNNKGETALFVACKKGHKGAVCALLKYAADSLLGNKQGQLPETIAREKNYPELAKLCKEKAFEKTLQRFGVFKQTAAALPHDRNNTFIPR